MTRNGFCPIRRNYHTHTYRCLHAKGDVLDYCQAARREGLLVLGISDHTPLPDNRWKHVRMEINELPEYSRAIDAAKSEYSDLNVLKGMECEYDDIYHSYFKDELLGRYEFDYLIGSVHWFPHRGEWVVTFSGITDSAKLKSYTKHFIKTIESGLFDFIAHPDMFGNCYHRWDDEAVSCSKEMIQAAQDLKIPLEINSSGFYKPYVDTLDGLRPMYPLIKFWELAATYDIEIVVNSDAHQPKDVARNMENAYALSREFGFRFADLSYIENKSHACEISITGDNNYK